MNPLLASAINKKPKRNADATGRPKDREKSYSTSPISLEKEKRGKGKGNRRLRDAFQGVRIVRQKDMQGNERNENQKVKRRLRRE